MWAVFIVVPFYVFPVMLVFIFLGDCPFVRA